MVQMSSLHDLIWLKKHVDTLCTSEDNDFESNTKILLETSFPHSPFFLNMIVWWFVTCGSFCQGRAQNDAKVSMHASLINFSAQVDCDIVLLLGLSDATIFKGSHCIFYVLWLFVINCYKFITNLKYTITNILQIVQ